MSTRRLELLSKAAQWIRRVEPTVIAHFADGEEIDPSTISPELEECHTQYQRDAFRYCRYLSSVPYSDYVGRRMQFLVRDGGIHQRPIMGVAALGSSVMQLRCRDQWIGWNEPGFREMKKSRIANLMDMYVAVAVPPYNDLLAGKLICYMMASNDVRSAFAAKYGDRPTLGRRRIVKDLVMIVTTSVYGRRSSQYSRIGYGGQLLYTPLGETAGFGTLHIADDTFSAFREMLAAEGNEPGNRFGDGVNWRMRVIRHGIGRLGFDADDLLRHGSGRGVYAVELAHNARDFLRGDSDQIHHCNYPMTDMVSHWRKRWLEMRCSNVDVMRRVREFRRDTLRLSRMTGE